MEQKDLIAFCPICYSDISEIEFLCEFEVCLHSICYCCFENLKKHSDKCPICGILYSLILKKAHSKDFEVVEFYQLNENDFKEINKNKIQVLGKLII